MLAVSVASARAGEHGRALLYRFWDPEHRAELPSAARLTALTPCLLGKGAAALAYRRIRADARLAQTPAGQSLHAAYRLYAASAAVHEQRLARSIALVERAGVTPILFKGHAAARLYPAPGLRPSGDVDLLVPASAARDVLGLLAREQAREQVHVDLHSALTPFEPTDYDALLARAQRFSACGVTVRALSAEDALRQYCLHWLKHGGERPIWLCDIALLTTQHARDLDWTRVLGADSYLAAWVARVLALASDLLGAPHVAHAVAPEAWLRRAVVNEWGTLRRTRALRATTYLRTPLHWPEVIADRWPNPIELAGKHGYPPEREPLRAQLACFANSLAAFLRARA